LFWLLIAFTANNVHGQNVLAERVYLQTDKQLYLAGELVYLKAFTVTPEKLPLMTSKIVYVELLDETNSREQIKIELTNGVGEGWMELPLDLPTGHYRLTAYTRYMRNEGATVFFEKYIGVVNTFRPNQIRKTSAEDLPRPPEIHFSPTCSLQLDKSLYTNREKGILKLDGLPADIHTLSVSIAGKPPVVVDDANDIRQWEKQIQEAPDAISGKYFPEYEGHIISGKIVPVHVPSPSTLDDLLVPILTYPGEKIYLFEGQKDKLNNVLFYTTHTAGVKEMSTTAYYTGRNIFRIDLQSPFVEHHPKIQLPALRIDSTHFQSLADRTIALQALYSFTKDSLMKELPDDFRFNMKPANTYILDEWTRFTLMSELVIECISELRFRRNTQQKWEMCLAKRTGDGTSTNDLTLVRPLVILDGIPIMDHELMYHYNPLLVERINIYTGDVIYGGMKFGGIVEFLSYKRNYPSLPVNASTQIVNYTGTQAPRRLYAPDYSTESNHQSRLPDFRHTLLWEPLLQTKGKSTLEVPFYTSDFVGGFIVTVEGLTMEGEIIFGTGSFEVR
jgi:hypothetical protein